MKQNGYTLIYESVREKSVAIFLCSSVTHFFFAKRRTEE